MMVSRTIIDVQHVQHDAKIGTKTPSSCKLAHAHRIQQLHALRGSGHATESARLTLWAERVSSQSDHAVHLLHPYKHCE